MSRLKILFACIVSTAVLAAQPPTIVPTPREVKWSAEAPASIASDSVAIVLGKQATDPEQHAAYLLAEFVQKRFGQKWPTIREGEEQATHQTLVILGQRSTCQKLDELCRKQNIELSGAAPGHDGYVIASANEGGKFCVLIGGCNARAVQYGQDTFAQMLRANGKNLDWVRGAVRDWPVIPWRGRPQTAVPHYLRPGELDLYVLSRVNFIDLRSGIYAYEPGEKLNKEDISEAIKQAHKRGIIVYGAVNTGIPAADYPKAMQTYREMLELGADGLWLSFDDKGPGEDPVALTKQVLELGKQHNITGSLIATTPPKGSYPKIPTDFNKKIMAISGMETALWFWTAPPSAEAMAEAKSIGIKVRPSWWHNWPRLYTAQSYTGVPSMAVGWSSPDYGLLAAGGEFLEAVMPWGGNGMGQHYVVPVINWWGWNPAGHDWDALRGRIQSIVFGPEQAKAAMQFDDDLQKLFKLFNYSYKVANDLPYCPPRLENPASNKAKAEALSSEMDGLLKNIAAKAQGQTLIAENDLQNNYLKPMQRELEAHRAALTLAYPEDWWPAHQRKILDALYAGDDATVNKLAAEKRAQVESEVAKIQQALPDYPHMKGYVSWWEQRASLDAAGWKALVESRKKELAERVQSYSRQIMSDGAMTDASKSPPLEWGIGRWQSSNRLLASVLPSPNDYFWGSWIAGRHSRKGLDMAVFTADRKMPGTLGEYAELTANIPVSGDRNRLGLLLFASATNKDLFSNTMIPFRWADYRFMQVVWGDKVLWEADMGRLPGKGEWFMVRLPRIPDDVKELKLRVRVEDRRTSMNNYTISYFGPIRLMELPE